jgi:predicted ATP-grasp superfamily ATP-dependent carboligase
MKILVTDGDQRPALAVTRALGQQGAEVVVGEERRRSLAAASTYSAGHVIYPSPYRDPEGFSRFLPEFIQRARVDIVIPISEVTTYLIAFHKELQQYARIPIPEFEAFDFVSNKWALLQHAQKLNIPIPRTLFVDGPDELDDILTRVAYPAVVKPFRSRLLTAQGWLVTRVHYANSPTELRRLYREQAYLRYPSLIQERVVGPGVGLFVLCNRGELVAIFSHRRLREKPPSGGVSVLRESIPVDPRLRDAAMQLFKPLRWHGVAMVEYKLDRSIGQAVLMEVNGRFWGSLQLAIDAGMNFPSLLCRLATDGASVPSQEPRIGVKSRWLLGDLDHLLMRLFKRASDLHLPEGFPSRTQTLLQFLKFYEPGLHYEILSLRDPRPFLYELAQYLRHLFG